jgi:hypothetical protein
VSECDILVSEKLQFHIVKPILSLIAFLFKVALLFWVTCNIFCKSYNISSFIKFRISDINKDLFCVNSERYNWQFVNCCPLIKGWNKTYFGCGMYLHPYKNILYSLSTTTDFHLWGLPWRYYGHFTNQWADSETKNFSIFKNKRINFCPCDILFLWLKMCKILDNIS